MQEKKYKFSKAHNNDFFEVLKARVNAYFKENGINKQGHQKMLVKALVMFLIYFTPYTLMLVFNLPIGVFLILWAIMGLGMAGIGLSVMHDGNHGAFSHHKWLNKVAGLSANIIGGHATLWKLQHNVLHHTYTNVIHADDDIEGPSILRFSPHHPHKKIHQYQHYFAFFLYTLMTLGWSGWLDYTQAFRFNKRGFFKAGTFKKEFLKIVLWKIIYFSYIIILPIFLFNLNTWWVLLGFLLMNMVSGLILSLIFQLAHVMPNSSYPTANKEGVIENNWAKHQLLTTCNFAQKSTWFTWYIGGLNYQIEHHLFSNICHIHYPKIAKIVKETAQEFDIPYNDNGNFLKALKLHYQMLKQLGKASA